MKDSPREKSEDIDIIAQVALEEGDTHTCTYAITKLRESERKLTKFQSESEKCFQNILADLSSHHNKYLSKMARLHENLQRDIKDLAGLKQRVSGFGLPTALSPFSSVPGSPNIEPKDKFADELIQKFPQPPAAPYFVKVAYESEKLDKPPIKEAELKPTSTDGQTPLTESVFKDHLFSTMLPVYGMKDAICDSLIPIYEQIKEIAVHTRDIKYHSDDLDGASQLRLPVQPNHHEITLGASNLVKFIGLQQDEADEAEECIGSEETEQAGTRSTFFASLPKPVSALARGKSKLNFADDILRGNEPGSVDLLSIMHAYRMPGEGSDKAIFSWFGAEPERTSCLAKALNSAYFENLIAVVIVANMVFMTYSSDYAVAHPQEQSTHLIRVLEFSFQLFYALELLLKLSVHWSYYFVAGDWHWNCLDFLLVVTSSYDVYMSITGQNWDGGDRGKSSFNLTFLRVLRLARFLKVIRVFRVVRFVSHLHSLLKVVASTLQPLFWCSSLLLCFFYIFAIVFVNATSAYLETDPILDPRQKDKILDYWGSVSTAMVSLYKSTTGGVDWGDVADVLYDMGIAYYSMFLFFIAFIILALLNILTGIFVDSAMKVTAEDKDGEAVAKLAAERSTVLDLAKLHCVLSGKNVEDNGTITLDQFEICMASPAMRARFSVMGLEIWDSKEFFQQLVVLGDSEEVDLRTFVAGCMQMRGSAQRLGLQTLIGQVSHLIELVKYGHQHQRRRSRKMSTASSMPPPLRDESTVAVM
mmetsp:Transcript_91535/g.144652  ORF Transcript_91535/g.144652 Transcript_91535/m.144652 type:complete len:757 (-) Transcript_91535:32-2302(-)